MDGGTRAVYFVLVESLACVSFIKEDARCVVDWLPNLISLPFFQTGGIPMPHGAHKFSPPACMLEVLFHAATVGIPPPRTTTLTDKQEWESEKYHG